MKQELKQRISFYINFHGIFYVIYFFTNIIKYDQIIINYINDILYIIIDIHNKILEHKKYCNIKDSV